MVALRHSSDNVKFIHVSRGLRLTVTEYMKNLKTSIPDKVYGGIISKLFSEISAM